MMTVDDTGADVGRSRQPWLHELQIAVRGTATCLSDRAGDMTSRTYPGTAGGLYVDDRRVVHHLRLTVDDVVPVPVAADSAGAESAVLAMARNAGDPGADPTVHLQRTLTLVDGGLDLSVVITSRSLAEVHCVVRIELAGDGAELHEVKAGTIEGPPLRVTIGPAGRAGWRDERHETMVEAPDAALVVEAGTLVATWEVGLAPATGQRLRLRIRATRTSGTGFDAGCGSDAVGWGRVVVEAQDARLARAAERSLIDLRSLLLTDPRDHRDIFAAAGSPWYLTLFGRDSLWAARMCLPFGTELARGTLRALARRQGTVDDPARAEQPGKILHEVRRTTFEDPGKLHLPPLYFGTVDATPLWIVLLHDAWRWGLDPADVDTLAPALDAALGWMRRAVDNSVDGFLRYADTTGTGLVNQGWKDSGDAMRDARGRVATGSIALLETQAYAVEAATGAADLMEQVLGEPADAWRDWADALTARVRAAFWCDGDQGRYLAMGLAGDGSLVDGVGSNMGHVLGTGLLSVEEEQLVADRLASPDLLGPLGLSTLSRHNPAFNPLGYHTGSVWTHDTAIAAWGLARTGHGATAAAAVRALVDVAASSGYRWPELYGAEPVLDVPAPYPASCRPQAWSAASVGLILSTCLGLRADAPDRTLTVVPLRPAPFGALRVAGLMMAGQPFSVETDDAGWLVEVDGPDGARVRS